AVVVVVAGCSGSPPAPWDGAGGSGTGATSAEGGSPPAAGGGASSGGSGAPGGGGSGGGASSGSSGSSGGANGSGSGGAADAGASSSPDAAAGDAAARVDATTPIDAAASNDAGASAGGDAGLCAGADVWLTPMNQARAAVNAGEPPLVCDPIAAQVALNYASQCNYAHNANRNSDYTALGGTGGLGENIAAGAPTFSPAQAVAAWVAESQFYNHATNTCSAPTGQSCGHYTQVVWKATTAVGCAHVTCTTNSPFQGGGNWDFDVCDYNPPGNVGTQSPY
ncbi:MAG TPA: CAP domain-containing protein, partial [Polyangiaceae bacterium]|nr:CAP domain-containing protein [Polyangiaceae bacterium]